MSSSSLCVSCSMQFSLFKRKNRCSACRLLYCSQCFRKGESLPRRNVKQCLKCHVLSSQPFIRSELMLLPVKELKAFLEQKNVSSIGCTEKGDLVDVIINHQARPQVQMPHAREAQGSTHVPSSSQTQAPSRTSTQNATQGMNDFFGVQINPEIHEFVQNMFQMDESGYRGLQPPSHDPYNITSQSRDEQEMSYHSPNNQQRDPHYHGDMGFAASRNAQVGGKTNRIPLDSLKDVNDIKKLSAKELKVLLDENFVDYKGCIEKDELVQRALMLWESKKHQQNASASVNESPGSENEVCKVCMDHIIDCVFLECGHLVTCIDCGKKLRECPMCRQNIVRIVRVFKS